MWADDNIFCGSLCLTIHVLLLYMLPGYPKCNVCSGDWVSEEGAKASILQDLLFLSLIGNKMLWHEHTRSPSVYRTLMHYLSICKNAPMLRTFAVHNAIVTIPDGYSINGVRGIRHSKTALFSCWSQSLIKSNVCFGSLSWWKLTKLVFLCSCQVPAEERQSTSMRLPRSMPHCRYGLFDGSWSWHWTDWGGKQATISFKLVLCSAAKWNLKEQTASFGDGLGLKAGSYMLSHRKKPSWLTCGCTSIFILKCNSIFVRIFSQQVFWRCFNFWFHKEDLMRSYHDFLSSLQCIFRCEFECGCHTSNSFNQFTAHHGLVLN